MLQPMGIPRSAWVQEEWLPETSYPTWIAEAAAPCRLLGATVDRNCPVFSPEGCLPDSVGTVILTDRGIRRLLLDELGKAKGVPAEWLRQEALTVRAMNQLTDLHIWMAVVSGLTPQPLSSPQDVSTPVDELDLDTSWVGFAPPRMGHRIGNGSLLTYVKVANGILLVWPVSRPLLRGCLSQID